MKHRVFILLVAVALGACASKQTSIESVDDALKRRDTELVLEKCDVSSNGAQKIDVNNDGRPEIVQVMKGGREACRTADLNLDGRVDRTTFFDKSGAVRRIESDFDRDGLVDEIALFKAGKILEKHRGTTLDGKLDTWDFFVDEQVARTERDENGDGVIDQWWEYPTRGCPLIHVDTDGDGRPNPGASIDYCKETGYQPPPLPGDITEKKADFGKSDARVEELSNRAQSEGGAEATADFNDPPAPSADEVQQTEDDAASQTQSVEEE